MGNEDTALARQQTMDLSTYPADKYNVLSATNRIVSISPLHMTSVSFVQLSPDPNAGDVYKQGSRKTGRKDAEGKDIYTEVLCLTKVGLTKLVDAAGIVWDMDRTRRVDDRSDHDYCEFEAVGGIRMPDGRMKWVKGTNEIDMKTISEEITRDWQVKIGTKVYVNYKQVVVTKEVAADLARRDILAFRRHMVARCETGAMNRVSRVIMQVKNGYTPDELAKPFVVPRIDFCPDPNDPEMKRLQYQAAQRALGSMYNPPSATAEEVAPITAEYREVAAPEVEVAPGEESAIEVTVDTTTGEVVEQQPAEVTAIEGDNDALAAVPVDRQECVGEIRKSAALLNWNNAQFVAYINGEFDGAKGTADLTDEQIRRLVLNLRKQLEVMP